MCIKIGKMPGRVAEFAFVDETTVEDAINNADVKDFLGDITGFEIRVNGRSVDMDTVLEDGDTIFLVTKIKGNDGVVVKIGKMPGRVAEFGFGDDTTIEEAMENPDVKEFLGDTKGFETRVNGRAVLMDTVLEDGDTIFLVTKIKGN